MDENTYASLKTVLAFIKEDNVNLRRHWEEKGKPADHIYTHIQRLSDWADEVAKDY